MNLETRTVERPAKLNETKRTINKIVVFNIFYA